MSSPYDHLAEALDRDLNRPRAKAPIYCSFCGKSHMDVVVLICGPTVFICDECSDIVSDLVAERRLERIRWWCPTC